MSVLRNCAGLLIGILVTSASALAQNVPQASCPHPDCPAPVPEPAPATSLPAEPAPAPVPEPAPAPIVYEEPRESWLERNGIGVSLGGGVAGFTQDDMRDTTDDGGAWGVRVAFGTRSLFGVEAEYIGSAQNINALGLDNATQRLERVTHLGIGQQLRSRASPLFRHVAQ